MTLFVNPPDLLARVVRHKHDERYRDCATTTTVHRPFRFSFLYLIGLVG